MKIVITEFLFVLCMQQCIVGNGLIVFKCIIWDTFLTFSSTSVINYLYNKILILSHKSDIVYFCDYMLSTVT